MGKGEGKSLNMGKGIEFLRKERGDEEVTFNDVCDHLLDYSERHPENAAALEDFARFLANVEDIDHDHERDPKRGMEPQQDAPH